MQGSMDRLEHRLDEFIAKLDKAVFTGNGVPPLLVRMSASESEIVALKRHRDGVMGWIGKLIVNLAAAAAIATASTLFVLWADNRNSNTQKGNHNESSDVSHAVPGGLR